METKIIKKVKASEGNTGLEKAVCRIINGKIGDYENGLEGYIKDLMHGGCQSGFVGELVYYADTVKFHDKYEDDIWDLVEEQKESMGDKNIIAFIGSLNGADNVGNLAQFKNLLVWFAFEETARKIAMHYGLDI